MQFLRVSLPDHEAAFHIVTILLTLSALAWLVVIPVLCSKRGLLGSLISHPAVSTIACCWCSMWILLSLIPNNTYSTRRIFHSPLLSVDECDAIIGMTDRVAEVNVQRAINKLGPEELLAEPAKGWHKKRDPIYPTTDLHTVIDPFSADERAFLENLLDKRLTPIVSRIYGIPPRALRVNDLFFVRYDAWKDGKIHLRNHVDGSDISFNILLNDNFTEGGTRFYRREPEKEEPLPFAISQPTPGSVLIHTSRVNHEGYPISSGTRRIIVGFFAVNRQDVLTEEPTGLGWLNSWCSLNYVHVKLWEAYKWSDVRIKQGQAVWRDSDVLVNLLEDLINVIQWIGDWREHEIVELVEESQTSTYLKALDDDYQGPSGTNWYRGQHLDIDVDGRVFREWNTRKEYPDAWAEL